MDYTIRPLEPGDMKAINAIRRMPGVMNNIRSIPSERTDEGYYKNLGKDTHFFVAVTQVDGAEVVIGSATLMQDPSPRARHCGLFGIMIHEDYQDVGVGSALLKAIIDVADNYLMLVRIELTAYAGNARAIHVYEKHGFVREGVKKYALIRNGKLEDEVLMARINPAHAAPTVSL